MQLLAAAVGATRAACTGVGSGTRRAGFLASPRPAGACRCSGARTRSPRCLASLARPPASASCATRSPSTASGARRPQLWYLPTPRWRAQGQACRGPTCVCALPNTPPPAVPPLHRCPDSNCALTPAPAVLYAHVQVWLCALRVGDRGAGGHCRAGWHLRAGPHPASQVCGCRRRWAALPASPTTSGTARAWNIGYHAAALLWFGCLASKPPLQ